MRFSLFAILLLCACAAQAEQTSTATPRNLGNSEINPGHRRYPLELANSGVQGTTIIEGVIQSDGKLSDLKIASSSRSEVLDKNAMELVDGARLGEAPATPTKFTISIEFTKDSLLNLKDKTCADFIADFDYFKSAFPELKAKKMPLIRTSSSVLLFLQSDAYGKYLKREDAVIDGTVDQCRKNPDSKYLPTFMSAVQ